MTLEGSLEATVESTADGPPTVEFAFTVRNTGDSPVTIQFSDAGKAEFVVQDEGREIWRFSDGQLFAQMLSQDRLEAGGTTTYDGEWETARSGEYTVVAELRAQDEQCEARTDLSVSR